MYQGHLPDGSSVQRHSAGPLYPAVLGVQDHDFGRLRSWFVIYPGEKDRHFPTHEEAVAWAGRCNRMRAERERAASIQREMTRWTRERGFQSVI